MLNPRRRPHDAPHGLHPHEVGRRLATVQLHRLLAPRALPFGVALGRRCRTPRGASLELYGRTSRLRHVDDVAHHGVCPLCSTGDRRTSHFLC